MVLALAFLCYDLLEFGADFIVEDVQVNEVTPGKESVHNGIIGNETSLVGLHENTIGFVMIRNEDVQIATACLDWYFSGTVKEQFTYGHRSSSSMRVEGLLGVGVNGSVL